MWVPKMLESYDTVVWEQKTQKVYEINKSKSKIRKNNIRIAKENKENHEKFNRERKEKLCKLNKEYEKY